MEHRQIRTFAAVARALSFTRAAAELGYVQPNVTAQVKALERELGVPLFDRLGRKVVLTDAGETLLGYAERILELTGEARRAVSGDGEPVGSLAVSAPETLCTYRLPRLLRRFRELFPRVKLTFRPVACAELRRQVAEGVLDVAFLLEDPVSSSALSVEKLVDEPLSVLVSPDHPLALLESVGPAELEKEHILLNESGCSYRHLFEHALAAAGVEPADTLEFDSVEAIKQCVIAGMGVTVLPQIAVGAELDRGELAALAWSGPSLEICTQIAWHKDKWLSPALEAFVGMSRDMVGADEARVTG